jgi:hypothetical protein
MNKHRLFVWLMFRFLDLAIWAAYKAGLESIRTSHWESISIQFSKHKTTCERVTHPNALHPCDCGHEKE